MGSPAGPFKPSYVGSRSDLLALLPPDRRRVLDAGCATGELGRRLKELQPGAHVTGIELDARMAAEAETKLDRVVVGDLAALPALRPALGEERFDCIVCADVLEHLVDPWRCLRELASLLAEEGVVLASLPNVAHLDTLLNLVVLRRWPYRERGIHDRTHLRFFALANVHALLAQAGLEVVVLRRNLRLLEGTTRLSTVARALAVPGLRDLLTFQYLVLARAARRCGGSDASRDAALR